MGDEDSELSPLETRIIGVGFTSHHNPQGTEVRQEDHGVEV